MNGYAVIIRANVAELTGRQVDAIGIDANGTLGYDRSAGILRLAGHVEPVDQDAVTVLVGSVADLRRAVRRHAGEVIDVREARVMPWDEFEAETFRPATPRGGLAGRAEAAKILGVSPQRVTELRKAHPGFPRPVAELECGPVWDAAEVEAFGRGWDRSAGRPRKGGPAPA